MASSFEFSDGRRNSTRIMGFVRDNRGKMRNLFGLEDVPAYSDGVNDCLTLMDLPLEDFSGIC